MNTGSTLNHTRYAIKTPKPLIPNSPTLKSQTILNVC